MPKTIDVEKILIEKLSSIPSSANSMGIDYKKITKAIAENVYQEHRTLQQSFWRIINGIAVEYSKLCELHGADLRNGSSAKFTKLITKLEQVFPHV